MNIKPMKLTIGAGHGFQQGDTVHIKSQGEGRMARLKMLFTAPRIAYVSAFDGDAMQIDFRRMTWGEWREAVFAAVFRNA